MKILSLYSPKGGVGKSVNAVNISYLLASGKNRVILWDFDPQGASSFYLKINQKLSKSVEDILTDPKVLQKNIVNTSFSNLFVIPSDFNLKSLDIIIDEMKKPVKKLKQTISEIEDFDFLIIDSPPGFTNVNRLISKISDIILVPVIPTYLSMRSLKMQREFLKESGVEENKIMPFFSMADRRKKLHRQVIEENINEFKIKSVIPYSAEIEKMGEMLAPVPSFSKEKNIIKTYENFKNEILTCLQKY